MINTIELLLRISTFRLTDEETSLETSSSVLSLQVVKEYIYTFSEVELTTDNLPGDLDPLRTFATRHNRWCDFPEILQEISSVIIVPCKPGTDLFHYKEEI